jgi:hypothetical protein
VEVDMVFATRTDRRIPAARSQARSKRRLHAAGSLRALARLRSTLSIAEDGQSMTALWERSEDGTNWQRWMDISFRRSDQRHPRVAMSIDASACWATRTSGVPDVSVVRRTLSRAR